MLMMPVCFSNAEWDHLLCLLEHEHDVIASDRLHVLSYFPDAVPSVAGHQVH